MEGREGVGEDSDMGSRVDVVMGRFRLEWRLCSRRCRREWDVLWIPRRNGTGAHVWSGLREGLEMGRQV